MPGAGPSVGAWLWHGEKGKGESGKAWAGHREGRDRRRLPGEDGLKGEGLWAPRWEQWRRRPLSLLCASQPDTRLSTVARGSWHCSQQDQAQG